MTRNVFPLSCETRFLTFSRKNALGRWRLMMSATSKKSVPCVLSLNPVSRPRLFFLDTPAIENGWQGKPAHRTSKFAGMYFFVISCVMSPKGISPKLARYVCCANLFHSEENTHFPPWACMAMRNPPVPAKRSMKVNCGFGGSGKGTSKKQEKMP